MLTRHAKMITRLGELTVVAEGNAVTGLYFPRHWHAPDPVTFGQRADAGTDPVLARARTELEEYLAGRRHEFGVPLAAAGDDFQRRVWDLVSAIPYGEVRTYGEIAAGLGGLKAGDMPLAKEAGQALGRNPLCIFIPCHRVVGAGGKITGYAGGRDRKRQLLELEERSAPLAGLLTSGGAA